jgi:hypothetical protein
MAFCQWMRQQRGTCTCASASLGRLAPPTAL